MPADSMARARYTLLLMCTHSCRSEPAVLFASQSLLPNEDSSTWQHLTLDSATLCLCAPLFDASIVAASTAAHACSVVVTEEFAAAGAGAGAVCAVAPHASAMHRSRMPGYLRHNLCELHLSASPGVAIVVPRRRSFTDR